MVKSKSIIVVKIGTPERPATEEDFADMERQLEEAKRTGCLVTHHAVQFETLYLPADCNFAIDTVKNGFKPNG